MDRFDNEKYIEKQTKKILERLSNYSRMYLEVGGKIFDDYHASRIISGFNIDNKAKVVSNLKEKLNGDLEVILTISIKDIIRKKIRGDYNTTYLNETIKMIEEFKERGINKISLVLARCSKKDEELFESIKKIADSKKIAIYRGNEIEGYPMNLDAILSKEGFESFDNVDKKSKLIIVTGPGPGSGKMACAMSQIYLDSLNNIQSGYAKLETFPIWNLPVNNKINIAYECATADLKDRNMVDPYYLKKYNKEVTSYNRDVEAFEILRKVFDKAKLISYDSPTEMGVNVIKECINDIPYAEELAYLECLRRLNKAKEENAQEYEVIKEIFKRHHLKEK